MVRRRPRRGPWMMRRKCGAFFVFALFHFPFLVGARARRRLDATRQDPRDADVTNGVKENKLHLNRACTPTRLRSTHRYTHAMMAMTLNASRAGARAPACAPTTRRRVERTGRKVRRRRRVIKCVGNFSLRTRSTRVRCDDGWDVRVGSRLRETTRRSCLVCLCAREQRTRFVASSARWRV